MTHLARLTRELDTLASVLVGSPHQNETRTGYARRHLRLYMALLRKHGLVDADGRPVGFSAEADRQEEHLALSELTIARKVS